MKVGRAPENDHVVDQTFGRVSNEHATLEIQDGQLIFIDHSSNGSTVNGRPIHKASIAVNNGDKILLAEVYELKWPEILKHFPAMQRRTERFDGTQFDTSGQRPTEMFDQENFDNGERSTEMFDGRGYETQFENEGGHPTETREEGYAPRPDSDPWTRSAGHLNEYSQMEIDEYLGKFNLGAYLSTWVWGLAYGIYWPLIIIPISLIPYLGQACSLFLCAYMGINGNRRAWNNTRGDFGKFVRSQKKWIPLGVLLFLFFAAVQFFIIYFFL